MESRIGSETKRKNSDQLKELKFDFRKGALDFRKMRVFSGPDLGGNPTLEGSRTLGNLENLNNNPALPKPPKVLFGV